MKFFATVFGTLALAAAAMAQGDFSSLPDCGKTCINNLFNDAPSFGCTVGSSDEANCLCSNANFSYGIRDCSDQSCIPVDLAPSVINYGISYCSSAGVAIPTTVLSGSPSATSSGSNASSGGSGSAITTSSFLTTVTTDGSTITTSEASTIFASGSASSIASQASSGASSVSSRASSGASSVASQASTALSGSATGTGASSASSTGFAPQITAAPVGFLAAAGVAAMLL